MFNLGSFSWTMKLRQVIQTLLVQAARLKTLEAAPPQPPLASATPTRDGYELGGRCHQIGLKEIQISVGLWEQQLWNMLKHINSVLKLSGPWLSKFHFICWCRRNQPIISWGFDDAHLELEDYHIRKTHVLNGWWEFLCRSYVEPKVQHGSKNRHNDPPKWYFDGILLFTSE